MIASCILIILITDTHNVHWDGNVISNKNVYNITECIVCVHGHDPLTFSFLSSFLFWLGGSVMALIIWSAKTCALGPPRPLSSSVPAEAGRLLVCALPGHQCIWFRGEPVSSYFSMAYYSVVSYWCMLITISTTCLDAGSNAWEISAWKPPWRQCTLFVCSNRKPVCHKVTSVSNMYAAMPG